MQHIEEIQIGAVFLRQEHRHPDIVSPGEHTDPADGFIGDVGRGKHDGVERLFHVQLLQVVAGAEHTESVDVQLLKRHVFIDDAQNVERAGEVAAAVKVADVHAAAETAAVDDGVVLFCLRRILQVVGADGEGFEEVEQKTSSEA